VDDPMRLESLKVSPERVEAKLGWLKEFRNELSNHSVITSPISRDRLETATAISRLAN
jgi:hypothetical protein